MLFQGPEKCYGKHPISVDIWWIFLPTQRRVDRVDPPSNTSRSHHMIINSLDPGRFQLNFKCMIFELILEIDGWYITCLENTFKGVKGFRTCWTKCIKQYVHWHNFSQCCQHWNQEWHMTFWVLCMLFMVFGFRVVEYKPIVPISLRVTIMNWNNQMIVLLPINHPWKYGQRSAWTQRWTWQ